MKRNVLKSSLGDTHFYDFSEVLEMKIELDKMAFTAEVKEGVYASSSFRGGSNDHQSACREGPEEGGDWGFGDGQIMFLSERLDHFFC